MDLIRLLTFTGVGAGHPSRGREDRRRDPDRRISFSIQAAQESVSIDCRALGKRPKKACPADLVTYLGPNYEDAQHVQHADRWRISVAPKLATDGQAIDKLVQVTNGTRRTSDVRYSTADGAGVKTDTAVDFNNRPIKPAWPVKHVHDTRRVVQQITRDNGIGGRASTSCQRAIQTALSSAPDGMAR